VWEVKILTAEFWPCFQRGPFVAGGEGKKSFIITCSQKANSGKKGMGQGSKECTLPEEGPGFLGLEGYGGV